VSNPSLVADALQSPQNAERLLNELNSYSPLRAAALYDGKGVRLAQLQHGDHLNLPERYRHIEAWQATEFRSNQVITLPRPGTDPGHLLLVASSELPMAFYTGTLTASLGF
jgi:predicted ATPase